MAVLTDGAGAFGGRGLVEGLTSDDGRWLPIRNLLGRKLPSRKFRVRNLPKRNLLVRNLRCRSTMVNMADGTRTRLSAGERRNQLVEVGRKVFAEKGYEGTSVEEIAERAK